MGARRAVTGSALVLTSLALLGCAQGYDSVLWLQMDTTENLLYEELSSSREVGATRAEVSASVRSGSDFWDGVSAPTFLAAAEPAVVTFNFRSAAGDSHEETRLTFDALIYSGLREPNGPLQKPGSGPEGRYGGPASLYTCFSIDAIFADDRMLQWFRTFDDDASALCPPELVKALDGEAKFEQPNEFDG